MIVVVALAGGAGAAARLLVDTWLTRRTALPVGTLVVNATACLLLGLLAGWGLAHPGHAGLHAALGVGLLGGYSTFSTASVEAATLLLTDRRAAAGLHALVMLVVCVAAALAGLAVTAP